ncbi:uncharacterized protein ACA1_138060 [Acanthamoeba castellanii str. Neff]|uniref:Uncharacterized protein n=1 Tax=Acanthamoeba castellanii (strain ATCC 30010 / Neff) TaxID=1257118 RepID=L8GYP1_ACACF|nr:uncharacterized protein ACA1_138060 [Acanthamoeba castellanii str. Neff]ELR18404.1 hypothetical protein ACA1_138060 [Acanthamoeba castellanii str. Neff]
MNFMRSMVKEIEALTDSAVHATRQGVEGVAQAGKETVEGISQLANSALDEATAALETVSNMGEATLSLISNTMRPSKRRFHPLKPNIMRCACIGDSGVGKSTLLATWREGRYPAGLDLPSTIYDWLYFNYCLSSKEGEGEHERDQEGGRGGGGDGGGGQGATGDRDRVPRHGGRVRGLPPPAAVALQGRRRVHPRVRRDQPRLVRQHRAVLDRRDQDLGHAVRQDPGRHQGRHRRRSRRRR